MTTRGSLVLVLVMSLLIAACSDSDGETSTSGTDGASDQRADSSPSTSEATEPKTLDEYLGVAAGVLRGQGDGRGAGGIDTDQLIEEQRLIQLEIQRCMQAQGFTYVPNEVDGGPRLFLAAENESVPPLEFAETEGFGISTRFDALFDADLDTDGEDTNANQEHLSNLSEGEADAWRLALNGAPPERNADGQIIDPETGQVLAGGAGRVAGGCAGEARTSVRGDLSVLADLGDEYDLLQERIDADPRIAEIRADWADCMRTEGFTFESEAEARNEVTEAMRPLLRSLLQASAGSTGGAQGRQGPGNRLQALVGIELTPEQDAQLNALQDRERAIAVASLECQGDTAEEIATITASYEAEFVEANRQVLESIQG